LTWQSKVKQSKVKLKKKAPSCPTWGKTVRTNGAKWGSCSVTKGTFDLSIGLFLALLTFFSKAV
jgi:hypothetical protein